MIYMLRMTLKSLFFVGALMLATTLVAQSDVPVPEMLIVVGAPGEEDYAEVFANTTASWREAASTGKLKVSVINKNGAINRDGSPILPTARDAVRQWFADRATAAPIDVPLWFVFVGHGTYDGQSTKLNLPGPDVTAVELREWLQPVHRPMVVVHGGSASAPLVNALSGPDRIVIAATENGYELNFARFGSRFAEMIANPAADIDRDGQTSVLEAFVSASGQTQDFYVEAGRLATEHAIIDDNGDAQGTPYDWFNGTRLIKKPENAQQVPDGARARLWTLVPSPEELALTPEQRGRRDRLEAALERLRLRKTELPDLEYFQALEDLFTQLGDVYGYGKEPANESAPAALPE